MGRRHFTENLECPSFCQFQRFRQTLPYTYADVARGRKRRLCAPMHEPASQEGRHDLRWRSIRIGWTSTGHNEAASPYPSRRFPAAVAPSPKSAADRNPHSQSTVSRGFLPRGLSYACRHPKPLYGDGQLQTASRRHCHVPPRQSVYPFDGSVCVTRFANEPSPPYIRSGHMHLFHDPACGGFGPKRRYHSSTAAV